MAPSKQGKEIKPVKIQFLGQKSMVNKSVDYGAKIKKFDGLKRFDGWRWFDGLKKFDGLRW